MKTLPAALAGLAGCLLFATAGSPAAAQDAPPAPPPVPRASPSAPPAAPAPRPAEADADRPDLRPGDELAIRVLGRTDLGGTVPVLSDGSVNVPFVGKVLAVGRSLTVIAADCAKGFQQYERDPKVSVTVQSMVENEFYVLGAVGKAGVFRVPRLRQLTLLQALGMAGGFSDEADFTRVSVAPAGGAAPRTVDATPGRSTGALSQIVIGDGDTIVVPAMGRIYLMGQVNRTGGFAPPAGEKMTLTRALALAGGFTNLAKKDAVLVTWRDARGESASRRYDVPRILDGRDEDPEVFPGNLIVVPERLF